MAHGILCKHCGWQETDHMMVKRFDGQFEGEETEIRGNHPKTLSQCSGYEPEDPDLHEKLEGQLKAENYQHAMRNYGHSSD